jgi:spore germination protein YaaH
MQQGFYVKKLYYLLCFVFLSHLLSASSKYFVGGWVPYWKPEESIADVLDHIDQIQEIGLFSFEVDKKLNLYNPFSQNRAWKPFFEQVRNRGIKIVPTIYWTDTKSMHSCLTDPEKLERHINQIVTLVLKEKMDGININYEKVSSNTRADFLRFMQKLSARMHEHKLVLYCTLGARTGDRTIGVLYNDAKPEKPASSSKDKFKNVSISLSPGSGAEAEAFKTALVACCDRFYIMGYDEWGKPFFYSKHCRKAKYFISHSSHQWIDQALTYYRSYIPADKLVIAFPSYALEFKMIENGDLLKFKKTRNLSTRHAKALAQKHAITPTFTHGAEKCFLHTHNNEQRYVCFFDNDALIDRLQLVKKHNIKGVYFFKFDGGNEHGFWDILKRELRS